MNIMTRRHTMPDGTIAMTSFYTDLIVLVALKLASIFSDITMGTHSSTYQEET